MSSEETVVSNLGKLSIIPEEILYKVFDQRRKLPLVSKDMQQVLKRIKPKLHVTWTNNGARNVIAAVAEKRSQIDRLKQISQFYTITGISFANSPHLDGFHMGQTIGVEDWNEIFLVCPALVHLNFRQSRQHRDDLETTLGHALQNNPQIKLEYLNISHQTLTTRSIGPFLACLVESSSASTLKTLEMGSNYLNSYREDEEDVEVKYSMRIDILSQLRDLPELRSLSFRDADLIPNWSKDMRALVQNLGASKLESLDLSGLRVRKDPRRRENILPLLEALEAGQFPYLKLLNIRLLGFFVRQYEDRFRALATRDCTVLLEPWDRKFRPE